MSDLKVEHDLNKGMYNVMFYFLFFVFGLVFDEKGEGNGVRRLGRGKRRIKERKEGKKTRGIKLAGKYIPFCC